MTHLNMFLFTHTWAWWAAGLGLGLTAVGLAFFTGRRLGVAGGFEDACSILSKDSAYKPSSSNWKLWFLLGLPLGSLLANIGHWKWSWLYGQLDGISFGMLWFKILWLLVAGFLLGLGARWAGGCTSGHTILGVSLGRWMSIWATVAFLTAGVLVTNLIFKAVF